MSIPTITVAISGASTSGKTTIARYVTKMLEEITPKDQEYYRPLHVMEDKFFVTDSAVPLFNDCMNWDCVDAINLPAFRSTLEFICDGNRISPESPPQDPDGTTHDTSSDKSGGHNNSNKDKLTPEISNKLYEELKSKLRSAYLMGGANRHPKAMYRICIIDGFLLFPPTMEPLHPFFNLKILLRVPQDIAKKRREARNGYTTHEGFWKDPPGYFDHVVWPHYSHYHGFLFESRDVEGNCSSDVCKAEDIKVFPMQDLRYPTTLKIRFEDTLKWVVDQIINYLQNVKKEGVIKPHRVVKSTDYEDSVSRDKFLDKNGQYSEEEA